MGRIDMAVSVFPGLHTLAGKRVLVTGASGFLGSRLVERLVGEGAVVGALSRTTGRLDAIGMQGKFAFIPCNLCDADNTREAIGSFSPEILFHFAAQPDGKEGAKQAHGVIQNNISGTVNALEGFREGRGELFIYGDSCKVYGNGGVPYREDSLIHPDSSYAIAKSSGWEFCKFYQKVYGIAVVSVRPTLVYGPHQGYNLITYVVESVLDGKAEIRLDGGSQTRDPMFVDDAIDAYLAAARQGDHVAGRVVNIGGGEERSVAEIATLIVELMGGRQQIMAVARNARPTEMWRSYCDNTEAQAMLGWQPVTTFRAGLEKTIDYLISARPRVAVAAS